MAPKALRSTSTQPASVLKAAANATLKAAPDAPDNTFYGDVKTLKLPPQGASSPTKLPGSAGVAYPAATFGKDVTRKPVAPESKIRTVWEEETKPTAHARKLASLAGKVDKMAHVFEEGAQGRARQRAEMEALHNDQVLQLDEVSAAINVQLGQLDDVMEKFMTRFRGNLESSFDAHHSNLRARVQQLIPKLEALDARNAALRTGLDEERAARIQENVEILGPVKEQIAKLETELVRERQIRENRDAEIRTHMKEAVTFLTHACRTEEENRKRRHADTATEWQQEQARLDRRQAEMDGTCKACLDTLHKETVQEKAARVGAQDPIVVALTKFVQAFQADVKEKAEMGG